MSGLVEVRMAAARVSQEGDTDLVLKRILCPVDFSDFSPPVLAHAVALANWFGAEVAALHVFASWMPPASSTTYPGWMLQVPEARASIEKELAMLTVPFTSMDAQISLRTAEGDAANEIVRQASALAADLIVIGTHGRSGFDRFTLGSVTEKVLRKTPCPVLTLPPGAPRASHDVNYRRVLCPIDFSRCSERALHFAVTVARKAHAGVTVVHVVEALDGEQELRAPAYIAEL
jgi:nucleotide-binding universal stress UspA family protein